MKVALLCNMNNSMFVLQRYLLDRDVDSHLFILETEPSHFLPTADTSVPSNYADKWNKVNWGSKKSFFNLDYKKEIKYIRKQFDVVVACGYVPAFFQAAGCKIDLFIPYGSDLYSFPFAKHSISLKSLAHNILARFQRKGIINAEYRILTNFTKFQKNAYKSMKVDYFPLRMMHIYVKEALNIDIGDSGIVNRIDRIRRENDLIIVSNSRQVWKTYIDSSSSKGNDILIKGYADFITRSTIKSKLVLFEYGNDVDSSKLLIDDLDISDHVEWFPIIPRKEMYYVLSKADFTADQFILGDAGNSTWEGMVFGKPVFVFLDVKEDEFMNSGRQFPPVLNVNSSNQILNFLWEFQENKIRFHQMGNESQIWFEKYMSEGLADMYLKILNATFSGIRISLNELKFN